MRQVQHVIEVWTQGQELVQITEEIGRWVGRQTIGTGLLTVFCRHTSASVLIQETADPDVRHDLEKFFNCLVKEDSSLYHHTAEGPDDMPAHIRTALTQTHLAIPVVDGRLALGRWQSISLFEHRVQPHRREIVLHLLGE
jgi:secondary thiamine-phosphate synthase enzyme